MAKVVYLDNAATTSVDPAVFEAMRPYFSAMYGNPMTAGHSSLGDEARDAVEAARAEVARLVGASPSQIAFTSGGTESDNWAVKGAAARAAEGGRQVRVVASAFEHAAVLGSVAALRRGGAAAGFIGVGPTGVIDPDDARRALAPGAALVSVMHANNEVGTIQPIAEIAAAAHEKGALLHVDAVQTAGHIPVDVEALGCDFLCLSAHKFGGPKGVGALYARDWSSLYPFMDGGGQEWGGMRGSTHNVPGIVGLGAAARLARERLPGEAKRLAALRDRLFETLSARSGGVRANGDMVARLPHNLNVRIDGIVNEALLMSMAEVGVIASGCSACNAERASASHALLALGLSEAEARSSVRFSLGYATTAADVDYACGVIPGLVRLLRSMG